MSAPQSCGTGTPALLLDGLRADKQHSPHPDPETKERWQV
jgi:hypothetical protein